MTAVDPSPVDPILIGVDGSTASDRAIDLGVAHARRHGRPVRLVHAFEWPLLHLPLGPSPAGPPDAGLAADADRLLDRARRRAEDAADDAVPVTAEVVTGAAVPVMLAHATQAALVVIGDRGLGGLTGLLLGSVAVQLTAHCPVPVLVARGRDQPSGPVVVGVDATATEAVEHAFAEAAARGTALAAVSAWSRRPDPAAEERLPLVYDPGDVTDAQADRLTQWLAPARQRWPRVEVRTEVVHGRAAQALVAASAQAQLLVVGARGRGGFTGLLLGSVSQTVLQRADCPVLVVRSHRHHPDVATGA